MSAETLDFHYGKHHKAYVTKTNELIAGEQGLSGASLVEVVKNAKGQGNSKLFNNSAQLWNHSFFWQCLAPAEGQQPSGKLAKLIEDGFGNAEALLTKLQEEAVNHFASGWAWLVLDRGALRITSLHDADTPIVHEGMVPLFTLDVWEHAYYIDYRNERPKFADAVLKNIVNWDFVAENLDGKGVSRADQQGERVAEPIA
jgi:Fe-Mn family superoxide dismutase